MMNVKVVAVSAALFVIAGCNSGADSSGSSSIVGAISGSDSCDRIVGFWRVNFIEGTEAVLAIRKSGDVYVLRLRKTWQSSPPSSDSFSGSCAGGIINTNSMVGNASYAEAGDRVIFDGNEYSRSSEEAEANAQAAVEAQKQAQIEAQLAQREAQAAESARRMAETSRIDSIGVHVYNCYVNLIQCAEAADDARNYPADADAKLRRYRGNPENPPWDTAVQARARANNTTPAGLNSMDKTRARVARQSSGRKGDSLDAEGAADAAERAAGAAEKMQKF